MKQSAVLIYLLVLVVHLTAGLLDLDWLRVASKPLLLLILISYFFYESKKKGFERFSFLILFAMLFSLFGDILLIPKDTDNFFIFGLISFLIAHLMYIIAFNITYLQDHEIALIKKQGWVMILIIAYGYTFFDLIKDHLGEMIGPVMIYVGVITLMLLIAVNRYKRVGRRSFQFIFLGAVLFVISDSILAWNMFVSDIAFSHFGVMGTYGLAQLFIMFGAIEQVHRRA